MLGIGDEYTSKAAAIGTSTSHYDLTKKAFGRGGVFETVLLPQAVGVAKRRDAGFRRDPRARERDDVSPGEVLGGLLKAQWLATNAMIMNPTTLNVACAAMFATMFPRRS